MSTVSTSLCVPCVWMAKRPQLSLFQFGFSSNQGPSQKQPATNEDNHATLAEHTLQSIDEETMELNPTIEPLSEASYGQFGESDGNRISHPPTLATLKSPYDFGLVYEFAHQLNSADK